MTLTLTAVPALMSLPWELLYRRPVFLARQRRTPIVRHLETGSPADPPSIERTVRILGVVATPAGLPALDVEAERERVRGATAKIAGIGRVQLEWLEPATPDRLRAALRDNAYHVVHFVGHGGLGADGAGVLYLERGRDRRATAVDGMALANLLASQDRLRLVVLNACHGARTTLTNPFAGVAATLIDLGVPAVVAMQFEISDAAAEVAQRLGREGKRPAGDVPTSGRLGRSSIDQVEHHFGAEAACSDAEPGVSDGVGDSPTQGLAPEDAESAGGVGGSAPHLCEPKSSGSQCWIAGSCWSGGSSTHVRR